MRTQSIALKVNKNVKTNGMNVSKNNKTIAFVSLRFTQDISTRSILDCMKRNITGVIEFLYKYLFEYLM